MRKLFLFSITVILMIGSSYAATLQITQPNGSDSLCLGKHYTIKWTATGITTPLKLVLRKNGNVIGTIAENLPANTTQYDWVVGNYTGGTAAADSGYIIRVRTMDNGPYDDSDKAFPLLSGLLALTAPNGGESWELGSAKDITWSPGCAYGSVRLTLYKGGTDMKNRLNAITISTQAERGKYSWKVGEYLGNIAQEGDGYYIMVSSYTPDMKDVSNGPFTIVKGKLHPGLPEVVKCFELTYPRRGDRLRKGSGYTVKWSTGCPQDTKLKDAKLKLDLLKSDGTTLVYTIGENLPNNGQLLWGVPVLELPDNGLYKMRIQTMDGKNSDMVGPFSIVKPEPSSLPAAIKVTAPGGPSTPSVGITYPIRWTSTCGKSANGPVDDAFTIDLMNAAGSIKIDNLLDSGVGRYDGESPAGVHNWHWDWPITVGPGTYRIRVTNISGHCVGLGEPFTLVNPVRTLDYTLKPGIKGWTCVHNATFLNPMPTRPQCEHNTEQFVVGYDYFQYQDSSGNTQWHGFLTRSQLTFNFAKFKDRKVRVQEAILHLAKKSSYNFNSNEASCAGKVYILNGPWQDCWNVQKTFWKDLPHDQTAIDVNVTSIAADWFKGALANNGLLLTVSDESFRYVATTCKSCYSAELRLKIQEEYSPGEPQP